MMQETNSMDMSNSVHREALRAELSLNGIEVRQSQPGCGLQVLEIPVVPDNRREAFSILVSNADAPCTVNLSGFRADNASTVDCASADTLRPETLSQAVAAVLAFWQGREAFIRGFRAGDYDLA